MSDDYLVREDHARDRRVERGRDGSRYPAAQQDPQSGPRQPDRLAQNRSYGRAQLNRRAVPPHGSPHAQGQRIAGGCDDAIPDIHLSAPLVNSDDHVGGTPEPLPAKHLQYQPERQPARGKQQQLGQPGRHPADPVDPLAELPKGQAEAVRAIGDEVTQRDRQDDQPQNGIVQTPPEPRRQRRALAQCRHDGSGVGPGRTLQTIIPVIWRRVLLFLCHRASTSSWRDRSLAGSIAFQARGPYRLPITT